MPRIALLLSTAGALFVGLLGPGISPLQASSSLGACLAECKRPNLSATNRASCRLDCENEAASDPEQIRAQMARQTPPGPVTPASPPANARSSAAPLGCKAACDADRRLSVDDRASCKLDCEQEALPAPGGPPSPTPPGVVDARVAPPAAVTPVPTQAGFLARCQATCRAGSSPREVADFETCKLDCVTMSTVLDVARDWAPWFAAPGPTSVAATPAAAATTPARVGSSPAPAAASPPPAAAAASPAPARPVASPIAQSCGPALERCDAGCGKQERACGRSCARSQRSETDRETCKLGCGTDREVCQGDCMSASATCLNGQVPR